MLERPSKVKIPLGPEEHPCSMSTRIPWSTKSIPWRSKAWGGGWGQKSQEAFRTGDNTPPVGSDVPTSQCPLRRAGGREGRFCATFRRPVAGYEARGSSSSRCGRCAYVFVPETYATARAGASRWRLRGPWHYQAGAPASLAAWSCDQIREPFHGSNAGRGARPGGSARSDNRVINQQCCHPSGVCGAQANGRLREASGS